MSEPYVVDTVVGPPTGQITSRGIFLPGSTVWTLLKEPWKGEWVWIERSDDGGMLVRFHLLTAIDPNQPAEPVPQACPFCGDKAFLQEGRLDGGRWFASCLNEKCDICGPWKPTRLEAIQAWNRLTLRESV